MPGRDGRARGAATCRLLESLECRTLLSGDMSLGYALDLTPALTAVTAAYVKDAGGAVQRPGAANSLSSNGLSSMATAGLASITTPVFGWTSSAARVRDIVLVDAQLADSAALARATLPGTGEFIYDGAVDSANAVLARVIHWAQASDVLIGSLSILSHGHGGAFELGNQWISNTGLGQTAAEWRALGQVLAPDASLNVFGCDVAAAGSDGQQLIENIAGLTGGTVWASTDLTGAGGNWNLEASSAGASGGASQLAAAGLDAQALAGYSGTLLTNTGAWTITGGGSGANNTTGGITTTFAFTPEAATSSLTATGNDTLNTIPAFTPSAEGDPSLVTTFFWDTSPEGSTTDALTDSKTSLMTITFSQAVTDPVFNIDRIGGSDSSTQNSMLITLLTGGITLTRLSGSPHFSVDSAAGTIVNSQVGLAYGGGYTAQSSMTANLGTAAGSVQLTGTFTTVSFRLSAAPGSHEGAGSDAIEMGFALDALPVITSNGGGATGAVSVAENTSAVTTVTSTDVDGPSASYSIIGGADAAKFAINASTGALSFVAAPDYEAPTDVGADNIYDVNVEVSDGAGGTDSQALSVTVTPVNDNNPVITSNGGGATAAVNVAENATAVTTVTATDADLPVQTLSYSISGGADAAKFAINSSTGVLTFVSAPDYETPTDAGGNNIYDVTVQASDGSLTDTQAIAVTVTPVNDNNPVITSNGGGATAAVNVAENATAVTTVTATDADLPAQTLTYSITGGADAAKFAIDSSTGALTFVAAPDYEAPTDAGGNNVYNLTVQVSDGGLTDTQAIAVTVTPVNDNNPVITSNGGGATAAVNVAENATAVTTVMATDADLPAQTLTYSISGGADAAKFAINSSTGVLTFVAAPDFEAPTDAGGNNIYDVTVQVSDGSLTDTQAIAVTVTPVNDNNPVITSDGAGATAAVNVAENTTAVTTVTATDADLPAQTLTYSISGGADAVKFAINSSTGVLTFVAAPDYEAPTDADGNNIYDVTVQASDGSLTDTQAIAVTVTPVNDNSPVITSNGGGATAAVNVAENATAVTIVTATDADLPAQTLTYSISGGADAAKFTINSSTGALSFVAAPDYEVPTDAGGNNIYDVTVQASDGSLADTQAIAVTVTPVNDNNPVITSNGGGATAAINVAENTTAVTTVTATDADLPVQTLTYSISGGADAAKFAIDSSTGVLTFVAAPDYEAPTDAGGNNVYDVTVQASDGSLTDTQAIAVTVTPVNDNSPVITSSGGGATANVNVAENATAVTTVTATDADLPAQTLSYSISGGADAAEFTINSSTGVLTFVAVPDYETPIDAGGNNIYDVTVQASDGSLTDTQAISVTVTPVNDNNPIITSNGGGATAAVNVAENATAVTTVTATDADLPAQTLMYSIIGGADAAKFAINSSTGVLTFVAAPDYETPTDAGGNNIYDVIVQASDGSLTDTQAIAVTVTPVNDNNPIITSDGGGATAAVNLAENTTAVTTVTATDADLPAQTLSYSISGGADAAEFTIDAATGALTFLVAPNYEAPTDTGGNNVYDVTVQVSDGTFTDSQALAVTVTDVNEFAVGPVSDTNGGANQVAENSAVGTLVGLTAHATDADGTATVNYSLDDSAGGLFAINAATGVVTVNGALDYETATSHAVIVRATSSDGSFSTQGFTIAVLDVNEFPVSAITDTDPAANFVLENAANGTTVGVSAWAHDPDGSASVSYSLDDNAGGRFAIDPATGVVTVAGAIDREAAASYAIIVRATSTDTSTSTRTFTINVGDVNEFAVSAIGDGDPAANAVDENAANGTTVGITATASDADATTNTVTFSLDDNAGGRFAIDAATGVVTVADGTLLDREAAAAHNITVRATSADGSFSTQAFTIALNGLNDNSPVITSNGGGATAGVSIAENTTAVTTVAATDADLPAQTLTYSISGGADAAKFTIDSSTGVLTFVAAPDYETPTDAGGNNIYDVTVQASDGSLTDTQAISVTVTPVNDNSPVITSNGGGATAAINVAENATAVTTVTATDADLPVQTLTYSISGGADAAKFTIDSSTGALSFLTAPDYETPNDAGGNNIYDVTVQASDGSFTDTQAISVTVTPVNDNSPVITSNGGAASAATSIPENTTAVTTVTATDADLPAQTLTYSIGGGADAALFTIDGTTGALSFLTAPDYEAPTDAGGNNIYDVTVQVSDGSLTDTQAIAVTVTPVNDNSPVITSNGGGATAALSIPENTTVVTTVTATDADLPAQTLSYAISGGADGALFAIDSSTGALSFLVAPDYEAPADANADNIYAVTVQASDGTLTDTQTISVTVMPVNDNAPVITSNGGGATASVNVAENATAVTTVTATDADLPAQTLTFSIAGGTDAALFQIDSSTGALSFVSAPDYEAPADANADNVYNVSVQVSDGGLVDSQALSITVTPVNDNAPVITSPGAASIPENTTAALTVTATDADLPAQTLTFSIVGGADAAHFAIDPNSGALSFLAAPDYELPTDANADNVYNVTVQASDGQFSAQQALAITVTPVNDNNPVMTSPATASVAENVAAVQTLTAADADLPAQTLSFTISGGADAALFQIVGNQLQFIAAPDYEVPADAGGDNVYDLQVTVDDGAGRATAQNISVTVTPVNDNAPVITSNGGGATAAVSVAENTTAVTTVTATDADLPAQTLTFSIVGGADAAFFAIDASTGAVTFLAARDYETPADADANNVYEVTVQASDGGLTVTQAIAVSVTNVNEAPAGTNRTVMTNEDTPRALAVADFGFTDVDAGDSLSAVRIDALPAQGTLTLSGTPVTASELVLAADITAGNLLFTPAANANGNAYATLVFSVRDSGGLFAAAPSTMTLNVTPVNDPPVAHDHAYTVNEDTTLAPAAPGVLGNATDIEGDSLSAVLVTGPSNGSLVLNPDGSFAYTPAANFNGSDSFTYRAFDGAAYSNQATVTITINPVNDPPVITSDGGGATASVYVPENTTAVTTVTSSDVDGGRPVYRMLGGPDAAFFTINPDTGALAFQAAPDFESPADANADNVYNVTVQVSDGAGGAAAQALAVNVTNVIEPPIGQDKSYTVIDRSAAGTLVGTIQVSNPERASLRFAIVGDSGPFQLDAVSGQLKVADPAALLQQTGQVVVLHVRVSNSVDPAVFADLEVRVTVPHTIMPRPVTETTQQDDSKRGHEFDFELAKIHSGKSGRPFQLATPVPGMGLLADEQKEEAKGNEESKNAVVSLTPTLPEKPNVPFVPPIFSLPPDPVAPPVAGPHVAAASAFDTLGQAGPIQVLPIDKSEQVQVVELGQKASDVLAGLRLRVGTASALGCGVAGFYLLWLIRGGSVLASFLSSVPLWRMVDPLFVLPRKQRFKWLWAWRKRKDKMDAPEERFFRA